MKTAMSFVWIIRLEATCTPLTIRLASSTTKPGDAAPQMVEALQKAGVKDLPAIYTTDRRELPATDESDQEAAEGVAGGTKESTQVMVSPGGLEAEVEQSNSSDHVKNKSPIHKTNEPRMLRKKSVTFAEDTKPSNSHVSIIRDTERRGTAMANDSVFSKSTTNIELVHENKESLSDEDVEDLSSSPVIPTNESPEDTALRRQMLQYSMNEVGAIVAEIDLDDSGSHTSFSEDEDGDDQYTSADEEEDDFGRSTRRVVDDDYRRDMQELANKLNARVMENIGPVDNASNTDGLKVVGNASDANLQGENEALPSTTPKKKGVRFAEELDISKAPMPQTPSSTQIIPPPSIRPVSEAIIERATPSLDSPNPTGSNKKPSRFKTARSGNAIKTPQEHLSSAALITKVANGPLYASRTQGSAPSLPLIPAANSKEKPFSGPINYVDEARSRQVPEGPPGITHSATVIERPSTDPNVDVLEPDELDPALLHQEVAMEYHRMRNRMIQRNGGFLRKDEEEEQEEQRQALGEDESGGRKVSRFKAARLAKLGK